MKVLAVLMVIGLFLMVSCIAGENEPSFALGGTVGRLLVPGIPEGIGMFGGAVDIFFTPAVSMTVGYSRASVSVLGFEIFSLWIFGIDACVDIMPTSAIGIYVLGGGGYIGASLLGSGVGGSFFGGGVGIRLSPAEYLRVFIQGRVRWLASAMNSIEGGLSIVF